MYFFLRVMIVLAIVLLIAFIVWGISSKGRNK